MEMIRIPTNVRKAGQFYGRSIMSLAFNLGGLVAGLLLAASTSIITSVTWGLLLYPTILTVRGSLGGVFSGRLSTALHLGTVKPTLTGNTEMFYGLISTMASVSMISALMMWAYACGFGVFLVGLNIYEIMAMFFVMLTTIAVSFIVISPITILVSFFSLQRGLDPDVVTYPVISTVADIFVTIIYVGIIALSTSSIPMSAVIIIAVIFLAMTLKITWDNRNQDLLRRTVMEFLSVLLIIGIFVNIAGSALNRISQVVADVPHIYVVYPAIIDTVGDVGSIIGSTSTTKLNLGIIDAKLKSFTHQFGEIGSAWGASLTMFFIYGIISATLFGIFQFSILLPFMGRLFITNILSVSAMIFISIFLTIFTYNRGLDPDNFVIPVGSAIADGLTSVSLLFALLLIV